MKLPTIKEMVSGNQRVQFSFYQDGKLWYKAANGFEFPVPVDDTGNGCFLAEDKALFFMRWMRKHLAYLQAAMAEGAAA